MSAPLRFAHLADLHLDAPFRGLASADAGLQAALRDASLQAWDRAVDICLAGRLDFVLIAGDIYDQQESGVRAQLRFLRGLERLAAAGLPVCCVHGNHDPAGGRWPAIAAWPRGVTVFGPGEAGQAAPAPTVRVCRDGRTLAIVHGLSYPERHVAENLALRFHRLPEPAYQIGLLHATVGDHPEHGRYAPCALEDLRRSGLDYWALGHVHTRQTVHPAFPAVVYPGNLQARHPGEEGAHGLVLVEVDPGGESPPRVEFHAADLWRFARLTLDLGRQPVDSPADLADRLGAAAQARRGDRGLIASAELTGATALHAALARRGQDADLLRQLRQDAAGSEGLWWDALHIRTRPLRDREARLAAGDFLGDLLRGSDARRAEAPGRISALLAELRAAAELGALREQIDWGAIEAEAADLWVRAEQLAFDRLDEQAAAP